MLDIKSLLYKKSPSLCIVENSEVDISHIFYSFEDSLAACNHYVSIEAIAKTCLN